MSIQDKMISSEILDLFEETFEKVSGFYLDKKTSLIETIMPLSCTQASFLIQNHNKTIASHIYHIIFYIKVLQEYITNKREGKTDWNESWEISEVDTEQWENLKNSLIHEYNELKNFIKTIEKWDNDDIFNGIVSILVHCGYHLGAIRQMIKHINKRRLES